MTSQLNVALIHNYMGHNVLGLFSGHVVHGCLYNQALADVRSTGAGIKCQHCTFSPCKFVDRISGHATTILAAISRTWSTILIRGLPITLVDKPTTTGGAGIMKK